MCNSRPTEMRSIFPPPLLLPRLPFSPSRFTYLAHVRPQQQHNAAHQLEKENLPMISGACAAVGDPRLSVALNLLSTEAGGFQVSVCAACGACTSELSGLRPSQGQNSPKAWIGERNNCGPSTGGMCSLVVIFEENIPQDQLANLHRREPVCTLPASGPAVPAHYRNAQFCTSVQISVVVFLS